MLLDQEKHEHRQQILDLLVAQLEPNRQFKHGSHLVCAGVHANWLKVGFGGNAEPGAVGVRLLDHLTTQMPLRRGLAHVIRCRRAARTSQFSIAQLKTCASNNILQSITILYINTFLNLVPRN